MHNYNLDVVKCVAQFAALELL